MGARGAARGAGGTLRCRAALTNSPVQVRVLALLSAPLTTRHLVLPVVPGRARGLISSHFICFEALGGLGLAPYHMAWPERFWPPFG